ncbi:MAG TPA: pyridoxamine 5'-phosphate oxidase family protein [Blastocatellia bacterium]|nr:pyridoxamine 5'-phosphate oxidase family protein [Blastocatellia bacterium]
MTEFAQTERTTLKRLPYRGSYDRALVYQILDEGFLCHVGFIANGQPFVIPTAYARVADRLYIHGSQASRTMRTLKEGVDLCLTVTLVDGLVLARSAFHHSINYRSVMVFGKAFAVENDEEKMEALYAFTEHIMPGRWNDARPPNASELKATMVLALPLVEASAKVRTGPPIDDEEDYELDAWAGVLPLHIQAAEAIRDPRLKEGIQLPDYLRFYSRNGLKE